MNIKDYLKHIIIKKGGRNMAVLAKPINKMAVIKNKDSRKFICEFNKNKISKEFLDSCKKAGKLFDKQ